MKDFLGQELQIGDDVVFMQINYRNFLRGKIKKLSDKKATISHRQAGRSGHEQSIQFYDQIIKIS
jgi:hypothetical protein